VFLDRHNGTIACHAPTALQCTIRTGVVVSSHKHHPYKTGTFKAQLRAEEVDSYHTNVCTAVWLTVKQNLDYYRIYFSSPTNRCYGDAEIC
jgi:hypothetical protein